MELVPHTSLILKNAEILHIGFLIYGYNKKNVKICSEKIFH